MKKEYNRLFNPQIIYKKQWADPDITYGINAIELNNTNVHIRGAIADKKTELTRDSSNYFRIFYIDGGIVKLENLKISLGNVDLDYISGGGIHITGHFGQIMIISCEITGNTARFGGNHH